MLAYLFPGQGAQLRGMGGALFDQVKEFHSLEARVNALLGYSIRELCLVDSRNRLASTLYTQPALYVTNALHYYEAISQGQRPAFTAGHSLGEYNALLAAGAFDFMTGLRLVQKRAQLMATAPFGSMAAVLGLSLSRITGLLQENDLTALDIANINTAQQTVLSGPSDLISRAEPIVENAGGVLLRLPVSGAFHSRYMLSAASEFGEFLCGADIQSPHTQVLSNATGELFPTHCPPELIRALLVRQIAEPVKWHSIVQVLLKEGVTTFRELGPGNTLTRLLEQIRREHRTAAQEEVRSASGR
jgi:malonyl CoA-acyl carrier protein transacylase